VRRVIVEADGADVTDAVTGEVLAERAAGVGRATNNVAEYSGLIAGLSAALEIGADEVEVRMDSKLVVEQMSGRWQVKHPDMKPLAKEAASLVARLPRVRFSWIPREQNKHADRLANEAMDAAAKGLVWRAGGDTGPADAADTWLAAQPAPVPNRLSGWQDAPAPATTTILLRHGQTALSVEKRFSGRGDAVLTELGQRQAAAAAARLSSSAATAVVSSPLARARATGQAVADALDLELAVDEGLQETDFGDWEGYTFSEVRKKWPRELDDWLASPATAPPFGESFDDTTARVRLALARVVERYAGQTVVLVSHVSPIKTLVRLALDAPPSAIYRMHLDLASVTEVSWYADGPAVLRSFNDTHHLDGQL
jgi:broad specificity phosphatase PhoE/ribonuclease HI